MRYTVLLTLFLLSCGNRKETPKPITVTKVVTVTDTIDGKVIERLISVDCPELIPTRQGKRINGRLERLKVRKNVPIQRIIAKKEVRNNRIDSRREVKTVKIEKKSSIWVRIGWVLSFIIGLFIGYVIRIIIELWQSSKNSLP